VSPGTGRALRGSWGAWVGVVTENSGDVRECARAGPWRVRGGGTDKEGPRRREREKGRTGQRLSAWQHRPARQRGKRGVEGKTTSADRSSPAGRERERESAGDKATADRWIPLVRRRGHAAWLGRARLLGYFFFFFGFSNSFSISFL
jgi:hypothetical protein